jgi:MFS family permease
VDHRHLGAYDRGQPDHDGDHRRPIARRRLLGGGAFAIASLLAAFSTSAGMLIAARALIGVAGGTLAPSALALIQNMFGDSEQRRLAIAIWISCFAAGAAIGPLLGGALLQSFWWGAGFLPNVPVMVLSPPRPIAAARGPRPQPRQARPTLSAPRSRLPPCSPFVSGVTRTPSTAQAWPRPCWCSPDSGSALPSFAASKT